MVALNAASRVGLSSVSLLRRLLVGNGQALLTEMALRSARAVGRVARSLGTAAARGRGGAVRALAGRRRSVPMAAAAEQRLNAASKAADSKSRARM